MTSTPVLSAQISALRAVEARAIDSESLQVHWSLASVIGHSGNCHLLMPPIGLGRWGIDWTGFKGQVPKDPAQRDWLGPRRGRGKRFAGVEAGLGILDADGGFLREVYREFGKPSGVPDEYLEKYHKDVWHSRYRGQWETWAVDLLTDRGNYPHEWMLNRWYHHYWTPSLEAYPDDPFLTAVNARVRNSRPSLASRLAREGAGLSGHYEAYEAHIRRKYRHNPARAARAPERVSDRLSMALRVGRLCEMFEAIEAVD